MPLMRLAGAGLAVLIAWFNPAAAGESFRQLKGNEIRSILLGMKLTDGVFWGMTFAKGGKLIAQEVNDDTTTDSGDANTGRWRIQKDELCLELAGKTDCDEVWASGTQLRRDGADVMDGVLLKPQPQPKS